jgi:hypothetical protein
MEGLKKSTKISVRIVGAMTVFANGTSLIKVKKIIA